MVAVGVAVQALVVEEVEALLLQGEMVEHLAATEETEPHLAFQELLQLMLAVAVAEILLQVGAVQVVQVVAELEVWRLLGLMEHLIPEVVGVELVVDLRRLLMLQAAQAAQASSS